MRKDSEGSLTIEAVIALTAFLFFMMFMANFGHIYRAQNFMAHSLAQSGQMVAFSSYAYSKDCLISETMDLTMDLLNQFGMLPGIPVNGLEIRNAWKAENYSEAVQYAFQYCAGGDKDGTDALQKKYGIESIDFTGTDEDENKKDIRIKAKYTIHIPFAFFGIDQIDMHQQIVCRLWK